MANLSTKWIKVSEPARHVLLVELARFWQEYGKLFESISAEVPDVRAVVLSSVFPEIFSAGLDYFHKQIIPFQKAITAPERCLFPVIAAVHGMVVGLGVDMISACDIRYAASNAKFTIKVYIGLAADMGSLAYLPKITGNMSFIREMAYTAQWFPASKAEQIGLVSKVVEGGRDEVVAAALEVAQLIATKSLIAVTGTKRLLSHARDHSVSENLEYTTLWNSAMLQTKSRSRCRSL
ncbi:Delta2-dienoyl-CoA-isomerase [Rhodocollybia butyracea]|uniref:Delta2-dienoyl-CoA-isomerase n=1 Tax=Rhodocollybia butyracea TaxID=206335 RepID=A0A9P5PW94_9AGAR|nr:Delta2-dienoyl-CoA-isomerase [Rhodocollybia butyracea]